MAEHDEETRQERRGRKLRAAKERMPKHGAGLARIYADAVRRRSEQISTAVTKRRRRKSS